MVIRHATRPLANQNTDLPCLLELKPPGSPNRISQCIQETEALTHRNLISTTCLCVQLMNVCRNRRPLTKICCAKSSFSTQRTDAVDIWTPGSGSSRFSYRELPWSPRLMRLYGVGNAHCCYWYTGAHGKCFPTRIQLHYPGDVRNHPLTPLMGIPTQCATSTTSEE